MKKIILFCFSVLFTASGYSQTIDSKWNIGLHGGITQYSGDLGKGFYHLDQATYGFGGISVNRYLTTHLDVTLLATKGETGYKGFVNDTAANFRQAMNTATINFRFNLLGPKTFFRPYLFVGGGLMTFDKNYSVDDKKNAFAIPSFGGGVNIRIGPALAVQVQEMFILCDDDTKDGYASGGNDMFLHHTVGLTFNFGKKHDEDGDGIADRDDKCAGTLTGIAVDKTGCPLDDDKDGLANYLDSCPAAAGPVILHGCPDKDGDGIADKDDRCPDVIGAANLRGCPDTDGDGVADIDDKCAGTKTGYKVDSTGCTMDNDSDGIVNEQDSCMDAAGLAGLHGCPDIDLDGVADRDDRCPTVAGTIANKGCPEMKIEDVKKITQIASKIFFETNSDKLKVASLEQLDQLVEILKRYPEANLTIEGHTDNVGTAEYNITLSQKRTESVKTYLSSKGIFDSRLKAIGYGLTQPIADNKTSDGRAKNRRVELKTEY